MTGSGCVLFSFFVWRACLWVGMQAIVPLPPPPHFISRRLLSLLPCSKLPHGITNAPAPARFLDDRQVAQLMRVRQHVQLAPPLGVRGGAGGGSVWGSTQAPRVFTHTQHAHCSNADPVPVWQMKLLLFVIHVKVCVGKSRPSIIHHPLTSHPSFIP